MISPMVIDLSLGVNPAQVNTEIETWLGDESDSVLVFVLHATNGPAESALRDMAWAALKEVAGKEAVELTDWAMGSVKVINSRDFYRLPEVQREVV